MKHFFQSGLFTQFKEKKSGNIKLSFFISVLNVVPNGTMD